MKVQHNKILIITAGIVTSLSPLAQDKPHDPARDQARTADAKASERQHPIFLTTDVIFGCKLATASKQNDSVSDAVVNTKTGAIDGFVTKSGRILPFQDVVWVQAEKCFATRDASAGVNGTARTPDEATKDRSAAAAEASVSRKQRMKHAHNDGQCYLLSKLTEYPIVGFEQSDEGRERAVIGSIGGAFIDVRSGTLAFVSTSVGGVLGIGAESRVIPWSAVNLSHSDDGDPQLMTTLSKKRLENAPAYGEGPDNLDNASYRDSLYSFFGTDRADFDATRGDDDVSLMTLGKVLGADIVRGADNEDSLTDLIVNPENGQISHAICEQGGVVPIGALTWNAKHRRFDLGKDATSIDADSSASKVLASTLGDYTVMCNGEECGELEDLYFDAKTKRFAYIAVSGDGVRVLPWRSAVFTTSSPRQIKLDCSKEALKNAPQLDGKVGATIYSPAFRERVDAVDKGR